MKPVYAVTFVPDVPIDLQAFAPTYVDTPNGQAASIRCSEVRSTDFGFLQLLPLVGDEPHALTIFVPTGFVLYMLRAEDGAKFGFASS